MVMRFIISHFPRDPHPRPTHLSLRALGSLAAIAVASDVSEDDVMVYVVPQQGATLTEVELIDFCSRNMSYFMVPRYISFIDELPKTASEKIEKYKLKQMAERDLAKLWDREKAGIKIKR